MKKILSMALVLLLTVSVLPGGISLTANAACRWSLNGTVLTISGNGKMEDYSSSYYVPWPTDITEVIIKDGVTSIGSHAFADCKSLKSVTIPNSVTSISSYAFSRCSSLKSVTVPKNVRTIGIRAFYFCSGLESITIPFVGESRTASGSLAVLGYILGCNIDSSSSNAIKAYHGSGSYNYQPPSLHTVNITDATQISEGAFYNYSKITNITIPTSVTRIDNQAFSGCSNLSVVVGNKNGITMASFTGINSREWIDHLHDPNNDNVCEACSLSLSFNSERQPRVFYKNELLVEGVDYEITQGVAGYSFFGMGDYEGVICIIDNPLKTDISSATVSVSSCNYTGYPQTPNVSVKIGDDYLTKDTDFTLHYYDNTQEGTAKVIVIGKGSYIGYVEKEFTIGEFVAKTDSVNINADGICSISINGITETYKAPGRSYPTIDLSKYSTGNVNIVYYVRPYTSTVMLVQNALGGYSYQYVYSWTGSSTRYSTSTYNESITSPNSLITNSKLVADIPTTIDAKTILFNVSAENTNACLDDIVWASSNTNVGTIADGVFEVKKVGQTKITATVNGKTAEWDFKIDPLDISQKGEIVYYNPSTKKAEIIYDGELIVSGEDFNTTTRNVGNATIVTCTGKNAFKGTLSYIYHADSGAPFFAEKISVASLPNITEYYREYEPLDLTGAKVSVDLGNGAKTTMDITEKMVSGFNKYSTGTQKITVSCYGQTTYFNVNVTNVCAHRDTTFVAAKPSTCLVQGNNAYTYCNICNNVIKGSSQKLPYSNCVYSNSCDTSCNVCGKTRTISHTYSNSCDTSCNVCGGKRSISHTYSNSCDTSCNVCGVTRNVNNHIYSYSCDSSCNTCGYIRNGVVHKTILKNQKAATTTSTGYTGDTVCSVCNAIVKKGSTIAKITYTVSAKNVELSFTSCTYDGYEWEPIEFVYDNFGNFLSWIDDYSVTYKNNKYPGKGSVIIKFKGNYTGTIVKTFTIKPQQVTQNSLKSSKKKQMKISWKKATKVSGYEIVYATNSKFTKGKKTVKITRGSTTSKTIKKLKSKKTYYVKIRAYKTVDGKKIYGSYSKIKKIKIK